jgi:hypothetical protein
MSCAAAKETELLDFVSLHRTELKHIFSKMASSPPFASYFLCSIKLICPVLE